MNKPLEKLNAWCTNNIGILTLIGVIAAIVVPILVVGLDAASVHHGLVSIEGLFLYHFPMYIYQVVIVAAIGWAFYARLKKKNRVQSISQKLLVGVWKNEWGPPNAGHETAKITEDLKYYVNGQHYFDLKDFQYDPYKNTIEFSKVGVRESDQRRVLNTLTVEDNYTLKGIEKDYPIKYTKISDLQ